MYVFVAATARSCPASTSIASSAASLSAEAGLLVTASVRAPDCRAVCSTSVRSGEPPL